MKHKAATWPLPAVLTLVLLLSACGGGTPDDSDSSGEAAAHLNYGAYIYGSSLEPARSYDRCELVLYGI